MPSLNELGNAGDIRSPRRRRQVAGIHFRREAQPPSCKFRSLYSVSCANGLVFSVEVCKVRNNSPRTPLILPSGFAGSAGQGERDDYARSCGQGRSFGEAETADAGVLGRRGSGCGLSAGVSSRTRLRWPTPVRLSSDSRVKGRDFQMFFWGGRIQLWGSSCR